MECSVNDIKGALEKVRKRELELLSKLRAQEELTPEDWDDLDYVFMYETELFELLGDHNVSWTCVAKLMNENNEPEYWMYTKYTSDYDPTKYEGPATRVYPKEIKAIAWDEEP